VRAGENTLYRRHFEPVFLGGVYAEEYALIVMEMIEPHLVGWSASNESREKKRACMDVISVLDMRCVRLRNVAEWLVKAATIGFSVPDSLA
jgi:hypothetical protein